MLFEGLLPLADLPHHYRATLPDWAVGVAHYWVEKLGRPVKGPDGVVEHLRLCDLDVSSDQIFYVRRQGWKLVGRRGIPRKFDMADLSLIVEIAIHHPRITRLDLAKEFCLRTAGRTICPAYGWEIATEVSLPSPRIPSPPIPSPRIPSPRIPSPRRSSSVSPPRRVHS